MTLPHILIADPEYIIAMEAECILRDLLPCEVTIVNPQNAADRANLSWTRYALVLLDTGFCCRESRLLADLLQRQGIPVVFTTANQAYVEGVPGFPTTAVIPKPYDVEQVANAVRPLLGTARVDAGSAR